MGVPVPQIIEDSLPVVPQERVQNRTPDQIVDFHVPRILEASVDVMRATPQEHVQNRMQERVLNRSQGQIVDEPVSQIMDAAQVLHAPQECVQNRTLEHIVDVPVPLVLEAAVEVDSPQECVQNRTPEQIVDVSVPSVLEGVVEVDAPLSQLVEEVVQAVPPDSELDVHVTPEFDSLRSLTPGLIESWGAGRLSTRGCLRRRWWRRWTTTTAAWSRLDSALVSGPCACAGSSRLGTAGTDGSARSLIM